MKKAKTKCDETMDEKIKKEEKKEEEQRKNQEEKEEMYNSQLKTLGQDLFALPNCTRY